LARGFDYSLKPKGYTETPTLAKITSLGTVLSW